MINVLPQTEKKALKKEYRLRLVTVCFIFITILGILSSVSLVPSYVVSKNKEMILENKLTFLNKVNPDVSLTDLDLYISKINSTLLLLSNSNPKRIVSEDVILPLLAVKPSGIVITQILYGERTDGSASLDVRGVAPDRVALQNFKSILESNKKFTTVDLPISNFVKRSNIDFNITITIK